MNVKKSPPVLRSLLLFAFVFVPAVASAHQPRIVESRSTLVTDPEISKAYYGRLSGAPDVYTIQASAPFDLYVNLLVPDIAGQQTDVSAAILKDGRPFAALDGKQFPWKRMFEPFGYDTYWMGPEYRTRADAGLYVVTVTSGNGDGKYALAIGETENFDFKETMNALTLVPRLKHDFFNESAISFILSPFGWGLILALYALAGVVGILCRFASRKIRGSSARGVRRNMGTMDRWLRLVIGVALLLWAITTTWSPMLIFLSGFAVFEAAFSWCGLYAALGRSTCPVE